MSESLKPGEFFPQQWAAYLRKKEDCTEQMSLEDFLLEWKVSRQELATICECSVVTVNHWFVRGESYRFPKPHHKRRLAEAYRELNRMKQEWASQRYDLAAANRVIGTNFRYG